MRTILSAFIFMVAVLGGGTMALSLLAQTDKPRTPRNEHAAKLRRLAQQANQLANEADPAPLPPSPANAVALSRAPSVMPSPMPVVAFRTTHPSGAIIEVTMPTNTVAVTIPEGYYLTNRLVQEITLDEFVEFKRTNGTAVVWYFWRP
jgi:hypothetical protein